MPKSREMREFLDNLERWVKMQEAVLDTFRTYKDQIDKSDRLEMVIAIRIAFNHMIRTLKAFDQWLQDPFIVSHIPREKLLEVWNATFKMLEMLLELDINHTSDVRDIIEEAYHEGKLNPITSQLKEILGFSERRSDSSSTLSI
ncbi:DUF2153 family protein [Stetteria hydrogenophila]